MDEIVKPFTVAAGIYEDDGGDFDLRPNYKYIEDFATLQEALDARDTCREYPVCELTFLDKNDKEWKIELKEVKDEDDDW